MVAASADTPGHGLSGRTINLIPLGLGLAVLVVSFSVAYLSSIQWIVGEWSGSSGVLSHGYLIAAISIYIFVRAIPEAASLPLKPMWAALPVLAFLSIVWLLGQVATVVAVQTVVLPIILIVTLALAFGLSVARHFAFPVLFFYFAIPAVEHLQFIFQEITIVAVHAMIRLIDIVAYVEGKLVHMPEGTFAIESGCSGLNFVVSGLSLAALYGHLYHNNWRDTVRLAMLILAVAMVGNWIRVFLVVNIGYFYGMDVSLVADHLWLGWAIFAVSMVPVFMFAGRLESGEPGSKKPPVNRSADDRQVNHPSLPAIGAALLAMTVGPAWAAVTTSSPVGSEDIVIALPENVIGWRGPGQTVWDWRPRYVGASAERLAEFKQGKTTILAYANVYLSQAQGQELIYYKNRINGPWQESSEAGSSGTTEIGHAGEFQFMTVNSPYGPWLILHRNVIGGKAVIGNARGKFHQSIASLRGTPEAGVIAFAIPCAASCADAKIELVEFISAVGVDATIKFQIGGR